VSVMVSSHHMPGLFSPNSSHRSLFTLSLDSSASLHTSFMIYIYICVHKSHGLVVPARDFLLTKIPEIRFFTVWSALPRRRQTGSVQRISRKAATNFRADLLAMTCKLPRYTCPLLLLPGLRKLRNSAGYGEETAQFYSPLSEHVFHPFFFFFFLLLLSLNIYIYMSSLRCPGVLVSVGRRGHDVSCMLVY